MLLRILFFFGLLFPQIGQTVEIKSNGDLQFKVLSYNVKCLPFPKKCTKAKMRRIGEIIKERREKNLHPDVVLIQEGFVGDFQELVDQAGYKNVLKGSDSDEVNPHEKYQGHFKVVGSGLWILTDLPILRSETRAFKSRDCTSWDCYSNKGVLLADIQLSENQVLTFMTTHMNSGSKAKAEKMRGKQLVDVAEFISEHHSGAGPLLFAGDFNLNPKREHFAPLLEISNAVAIGKVCLDSQTCKISEQTAKKLVFDEAVDHHLASEGQQQILQPLFLERNFSEKVDGAELSDHLGYEVHYSLTRK